MVCGCDSHCSQAHCDGDAESLAAQEGLAHENLPGEKRQDEIKGGRVVWRTVLASAIIHDTPGQILTCREQLELEKLLGVPACAFNTLIKHSLQG